MMKDKTRSTLVWTLLFGVTTFMLGCAKTGMERPEEAATTMQTVADEISQIATQLDATGASLDDLTRTGQSDVGKAFKSFSTNVATMETLEQQFTKHADEMRSRGKEYFAEWKKQGDAYTNPQIRELSEQRRAALGEIYGRIAEASIGVKSAFRAYMSDLTEIQTCVLTFVMMLLAPTWQWMLLALAISQIPYALVGPSFGAFIAQNSSVDNRGKVYGITDTIYQVTGIVGPPLGGNLAGAYGFKAMLFCATLFYSSAAALRIWMARTMHSSGETAPRELTITSLKSSLGLVITMLLSGGIITWIFLTDGVRDIAFRMSNDLQPLYLEQVAGLSLQQIGLLVSVIDATVRGLALSAP